jgi:hypothetical protein
LDIGYAVPWTQMPAETYATLEGAANMDGFDLTYNTDIGDSLLSMQFAYGHSPEGPIEATDLFAFSSTLQADTWSARVAYITASLSIIDPQIQGAIELYGSDELTGVNGSFISTGFIYDPGDIYFITEYTHIETDSLIADTDSMYVSIGYRMGRWMPALTYAISESQDDEDRTLQEAIDNNPTLAAYNTAENLQALAAGGDATAQGVLAGLQTFQATSNEDTSRIGLSLRYDMSAGTALKIQYDIIDTGDEAGLFAASDYATAQAANKEPDSVNMLTISIDTVF